MEKPNFTTEVITSFEDTVELLKYLKNNESPYLAVDVESNSKYEKLATLYGIGICSEDHESFYIPFRNQKGEEYWAKEQTNIIVEYFFSLCKTKKLLAHNGIYDCLVIKNNLNIDIVPYLYADTILMKHMIEEEPPFGLKEIAVRHLGDWADQAQQDLLMNVKENGGKTTKESYEIWKADTDILGRYCCFDVVLTLKLFHYFNAKLKEEKLDTLFYDEEVMPLYKEVTIPMKEKGFPIDLEHFKQLKIDIEKDILSLEDEIYKDIAPLVETFESALLEKECPVKRSGHFPKYYAETVGGITLPVTKDGNLTLAKKELLKCPPSDLVNWLLDDTKSLDPQAVLSTQKNIYFQRHIDRRYVFNLNSNAHLSWLFFEKLKIAPTNFTPSGAPSIDAETLDNLRGQHHFVDKILDYKKLQKLLSTYIEGVLDRQINGVVYTSMLQFGTTSGRYASRDPNLNNLPALKDKHTLVGKYTNAIRAGFVAPKGYMVIGLDFESLEPHIAAYMSNDPILIDTFVTGKDFYSVIGIAQFNIRDAEPYKNDSTESFAVKYKSLRNKVKTYSLAAFYGATAPRISQVLKCTREEAQELLNGYFETFPDVKRFIDRSHTKALQTGVVSTKFGRVRHLKEAKELYQKYGANLLNYKWANNHGLSEQRARLKNQLNNAVNFQIQGLAAHALNRAMLLTTRKFREYNIDARIVLSVHDEILIIAKEDCVEQAAELAKQSMENCIDISPIKLKAQPVVGRNYAECK